MYQSISALREYLDEHNHSMVFVNTEILDRLREYLASQNDNETTISAIIAQWIDHQKVKDMEDSQ